MSVLKTFSIPLDIKNALYVTKIKLVEGDTANRFVITLTDDGTPVDLTDCRVSLMFSGPMGTAVQDSWTGTGDMTIGGTSHNVITVDVHNGAYATGLITCEVQVYSSADYTKLATSASFTFNARKPIANDAAVEASEAYPTLVYWSGKYQEMLDREQSDWTETDDQVGSFIQNKPVAGINFTDAIPNLTAETTLSDTDTVPFYDASASAHKKSTWANIVSTITALIRTAFFGTSNGILKSNGSGVISAAVSNTDYAAATHSSRHSIGGADALTDYVSISSQSIADAGKTQARTNIYAAKAVDGEADAIEAAIRPVPAAGDYRARLSDIGKDVAVNSSSNQTFTIPLESSVAWPEYAYFFLTRSGTGSVTIAGESGVTVLAAGNRLKIAEQYGTVLVRRGGANVWIVTGALSA